MWVGNKPVFFREAATEPSLSSLPIFKMRFVFCSWVVVVLFFSLENPNFYVVRVLSVGFTLSVRGFLFTYFIGSFYV